MRVSFNHSGLEIRLPADLETAAYRIVQEAPTNVARHARVTEVGQLWATPNTLGVQVEDRGAGYVLKAASTAELVHAVRAVVAGGRYLSPPLSELAIEAYLKKTLPDPVDLYATLTTREQEVLHLSAQGSSNAQIAAQLGISPRTAETYRANFMRNSTSTARPT